MDNFLNYKNLQKQRLYLKNLRFCVVFCVLCEYYALFYYNLMITNFYIFVLLFPILQILYYGKLKQNIFENFK